MLNFHFEAVYEEIPAKPPDDRWTRRGKTTQVMIRISEWPDNHFRLWLPEKVGSFWDNWNPDVARQNFQASENNGLTWAFHQPDLARVEVELTPLDNTVLLETRVLNISSGDLKDVTAANCLQFGLALDFACGDFARIYLRTGNEWSSLAALDPKSDYPHYFRAGRNTAAQLAAARAAGRFKSPTGLDEDVEPDHPLLVCVARDGDRSVGTASDDFHCLFHNRANPHLWCMHSHQWPVQVLRPGNTAVFRQKVYFVEGGLSDCVAAYQADPVKD
ncbi:MAG: hypothetical protein CMJ62_09715 [Planctomycetaceae bacterium]|nr:hypothetical protein [Planctomycetaceae bacterium]